MSQDLPEKAATPLVGVQQCSNVVPSLTPDCSTDITKIQGMEPNKGPQITKRIESVEIIKDTSSHNHLYPTHPPWHTSRREG